VNVVLNVVTKKKTERRERKERKKKREEEKKKWTVHGTADHHHVGQLPQPARVKERQRQTRPNSIVDRI
jgi:hypothetical protein